MRVPFDLTTNNLACGRDVIFLFSVQDYMVRVTDFDLLYSLGYKRLIWAKLKDIT